MAEVSIWSKSACDEQYDGAARVLKRVQKILLRRWTQEKCNRNNAEGAEESFHTNQETEPGEVASALKELLGLLEIGEPEADKNAVELGRMGGHTLILHILDAPRDDNESDLAARAVDLCMELCERFPMKGSSITACEENSLRTTILVSSPLAKIDPITLHMRRRMQDGALDTDSRPAREIRLELVGGKSTENKSTSIACLACDLRKKNYNMTIVAIAQQHAVGWIARPGPIHPGVPAPALCKSQLPHFFCHHALNELHLAFLIFFH
jgi:hypothetical protein